MKNNLLLLLTLFTFLASFSCYAENISFAHFSEQIQNISFLPEKETHTTKFVVLHPMVKDKVTEMVRKSRLEWKDGKCVNTVESFEQLQGKPVKGENVVGKSFAYFYIPKNLSGLCLCNDISDWREDKTTLKLDDEVCPGYRFSASIDDEKRECSVFTDEKGGLKAVFMGWKGGDLNVEDNSSESSVTWYFANKDDKLVLEKACKVVAAKQNGIPFLKSETAVFE